MEVAKENEIKISITTELSKALKDVQKENIGTEDHAVYRYILLYIGISEIYSTWWSRLSFRFEVTDPG